MTAHCHDEASEAESPRAQQPVTSQRREDAADLDPAVGGAHPQRRSAAVDRAAQRVAARASWRSAGRCGSHRSSSPASTSAREVAGTATSIRPFVVSKRSGWPFATRVSSASIEPFVVEASSEPAQRLTSILPFVVSSSCLPVTSLRWMLPFVFVTSTFIERGTMRSYVTSATTLLPSSQSKMELDAVLPSGSASMIASPPFARLDLDAQFGQHFFSSSLLAVDFLQRHDPHRGWSHALMVMRPLTFFSTTFAPARTSKVRSMVSVRSRGIGGRGERVR